MIFLERNKINKVALSCGNTDEPLFFMFEFLREYKGEPEYLAALDISTKKERYRLFEIELGVDIELVGGQYAYKVYSSPDAFGDTPGDAEVVEEGRMVVEESTVKNIYT